MLLFCINLKPHTYKTLVYSRTTREASRENGFTEGEQRSCIFSKFLQKILIHTKFETYCTWELIKRVIMREEERTAQHY